MELAPSAAGARQRFSLARCIAACRPAIGSIVAGVVALAVWEWLGTNHYIDTLFFSWPSAIGAQAVDMLLSGALLRHARVTLYEFAVGFVVAAVTATALGLLVGWCRPLREIVDPYIVIFAVMPRVALFPLLLLMFGVGYTSKIAIVFLGAFFPVIFNAVAGAKEVNPLMLDVAKVSGCRGYALFRKVLFPSALPFLLAGYRQGITVGFIMVVVGEFMGASEGIGFQIAMTSQRFATAELLAWVVYVSLFAVLFVQAMDWLEARFAPWRR
jgi:ABC-type nitrate/sulfonate/bicarbonate transport system permease component